MKMKKFDCVEMKETLQAALLERLRDVPPDQHDRVIREDLEASQSDMGQLYRRLRERDAAQGWRVAETSEPYECGAF